MASRRLAALAAAVLLPPALLLVLLAAPRLDGSWENHPAHFWLVLAAAATAVALGWTVSSAARRRRDARLFLVSLAFLTSAGFLGLHALATPGVLLGPNAGFELATPVGLVLAGGLAAASALDLDARSSGRLVDRSALLLSALAAVFAVWAGLSLAELPPLDAPLQGEQLDGAQLALAGLGCALYAAAAVGYARLYRRRRARFVVVVALAFVLLAEAMVVIAWARNWQLSWWEWHVVMLAAFGAIALAARREWHEERFSALYLDETLAGARDVSILFADLQGYTTFAEAHDPAEVAAMLNAYFGRIVPLLEDAGGDVHQLIGDAVMVIFNKAGDTPDHALRAARAGLELQRAAAAVAASRDGWPRFRVGVNSGEVLAGVVGARRGHRKHGVVGDTVNLAARLESLAPAGSVLLGAETARLLGDRAVTEPLEPLAVKGKRHPVEAHVLRELRDG